MYKTTPTRKSSQKNFGLYAHWRVNRKILSEYVHFKMFICKIDALEFLPIQVCLFLF